MRVDGQQDKRKQAGGRENPGGVFSDKENGLIVSRTSLFVSSITSLEKMGEEKNNLRA